MSRLCVLLLSIALAPAVAAQDEPDADCDSICRLPLPPPTDCACAVAGGGGTAGGGRPDVVEPGWGPPGSGGGLLLELVEGYERSLATISDYTVVASVGGSPPVVLFYEKVMVDYPGRSEHPVMRLVPQDEVSRRQRAETGVPDPAEYLGALGAAVGELGNRLGGVPLAGILGEAEIQLRGVLGGISQDADEGPAYGSDVFWDPLFLSIMVQQARSAGREVVDGTVVDKLVLSNRDFDFGELTDMDVTRITLWLTRDQGRLVPLIMRVEGWEGVDRVEIERRWDGRAWVGPLSEAHRLVDIVRGLGGRTAEAVTIIDGLILNEGLPSAERAAELIRQAGAGR